MRLTFSLLLQRKQKEEEEGGGGEGSQLDKIGWG